MALFKPTYTDPKTDERKESRVWWFEYVWNGERIRKSTKTKNERVAQQIENANKTARAKGEVGIVAKKTYPTFGEFAKCFEHYIETECADRPATVTFYKSKLGALLAYDRLKDSPLNEVNKALVDEYKGQRARQRSRRKTPISPGSVNRELATLRRILHLAESWEVIDRVPKIELLDGEHQREFILTKEQEKLYLDTTPPDLRDLAILMIDTGLRMKEALFLEWPNVSIEPAMNSNLGYIRVSWRTAKGAKSRVVPIPPRAAKMFQDRKPAKSGYVFHKDGNPLYQTWVNQQHAELRRLLKMPTEFVPHTFRHTYGTRLGESGTDAFTIMRLMGHSTVTVSQRYVHPTPEAMERAVERMAGLDPDRREKVPKDSPKVKTTSGDIVQ